MRQTQFGGATNVEEEKLLAVQEYLRCELKIGNEVQQTMEIENIFPAFGVNPTHLYVTFKQESSVTRIYEKTRIMRHGSRIINFVPRQFKDRSRAIGEIEYKLRKEENYQTRLKMGMQDLELWKKVRGMNSRWERVLLPSIYLPLTCILALPVHHLLPLHHLVGLGVKLLREVESHQELTVIGGRTK